jgi:hypothetical protein
LKVKQGGSKSRALEQWAKNRDYSRQLIKELSYNEKILILASLYWGEGTKRELNIINSDPALLRVVIHCLRELGVRDSEFKATLRVYSDLDKQKAIAFWAKSLNLPLACFSNVTVLLGKKEGKLLYGMCRLRVVKGAKYFKLIITTIGRIKELLP